MNRLRRFRKNKDVTEQKLNKIKSSTLKFSLIMLNFIFATFAWFTYTKVLDNSVDVHVSAWQVDFKDNNTVLGNTMQFEVGEFYPGMDDLVKQIEIVNLGDRAASIAYQVEYLEILGHEYIIKETPAEGDTQYTVYKSETTETIYEVDENGETVIDLTGAPVVKEIVNVVKILNNSSKYPFEIKLTYTPEIDIEGPEDNGQNQGRFEIRFIWPYEITSIPEALPEDLEEDLTEEQILEELQNRKNILDTHWGYDIANFYNQQEQENEENVSKGIEIKLQAIAKQII